jgi:integrase/recombinase XerD
MLLALQTGLRVSEMINLRCRDIELETGAHISCEGKGRKQRCTPLRRDTVKTIAAWLKERAGSDDDPVFPTIRCDKLSRDAVEHMVRKYTSTASNACASLIGKRVSPHVLRHSTAMELLQNGVDRTDRAVARARVRRDNASLHACRHASKRESSGARGFYHLTTREVQARRCSARIP